MKAVVFTLGCKVNGSESDSIVSGLIEKGYEVSEKLEKADLYIVNTCAVTLEAEKKSRQMVARIKKLNKDARMIFTGCAVQKNPDSFLDKKEINLVTGNFNKGEILSLLNSNGEKIACQTNVFEELLPVKTVRTRSYIKVQDGCNNFCSYCIVPYLRGRSRSRNYESVVREIENISSVEIVINGIDLSSYNFNGITLSGLMFKLKDIKKRIRLGSLEVNVITEEFLDTLKKMYDFAPHFHLSLQSGSDEVLKSMNRHYKTSEFFEKVKLIREYFPLAGITTDIIVGFPTEKEENFIETMEFVKKVEFSDIHCFNYSPRSGTVSYKMKDLDFSVKKARLEKLMELKAECRNKFIDKNIGKQEELVGEELNEGYTEGYLGNYLRAYVKGNYTDKKVNLKIIKPYKDGVLGEII